MNCRLKSVTASLQRIVWYHTKEVLAPITPIEHPFIVPSTRHGSEDAARAYLKECINRMKPNLGKGEQYLVTCRPWALSVAYLPDGTEVWAMTTQVSTLRTFHTDLTLSALNMWNSK